MASLIAFSGLEIALAVAVGVFSIAASVAVTLFVLVRLPVDYFTCEERPLPLAGRPRWIRISARIGYNLLGIGLIVVGAIMSVPGVPGQGVLTILLGVMLVDLPGKRRVERAIVCRRFVHTAINKLRTRFRRPPIEVPTTTPAIPPHLEQR